MMRVGLVGPLPAPLNGCSYANSVLLHNAANVTFATVNTNTDIVSGRQGNKFSLRKAVMFLRAYVALPRLWRADVFYLTPGQTFFGFLKYAPFMLFAMSCGTPFVLHIHGNHFGKEYGGLKGLKRRTFHWFASRAAAGIVLSQSLRANFNEILPSDKVHVVENFAGKDLLAAEELQKPVDMLRVIYLSNLMREKGILELLQALLLLKADGVPFHATIAGHLETGIEGHVREFMQSLGSSVDFLGVVSGATKIRVLREANVLVLPTYYSMEGQPIALLEGMATGNILITTAHAGIPDVVGGDNGYLIEARSIESVARSLKEISSDLPRLVARFSGYNRRYAAERFSEDKFVERTLEVLQGVCERGALQ